MSNNTLIVVDFVPSFVAIALAVINNILCFAFAFSEVVVSFTLPAILVTLFRIVPFSQTLKTSFITFQDCLPRVDVGYLVI